MLANIQLQGAKLTDWPQLFCFEVVKQTTAPAIAVHLWLWHSFPSSTIHSEFLQPFPIQSLVTQILIPKETKHLIVTPFLISTCFTFVHNYYGAMGLIRRYPGGSFGLHKYFSQFPQCKISHISC